MTSQLQTRIPASSSQLTNGWSSLDKSDFYRTLNCTLRIPCCDLVNTGLWRAILSVPQVEEVPRVEEVIVVFRSESLALPLSSSSGSGTTRGIVRGKVC